MFAYFALAVFLVFVWVSTAVMCTRTVFKSYTSAVPTMLVDPVFSCMYRSCMKLYLRLGPIGPFFIYYRNRQNKLLPKQIFWTFERPRPISIAELAARLKVTTEEARSFFTECRSTVESSLDTKL